jgi:hypothetical protein
MSFGTSQRWILLEKGAVDERKKLYPREKVLAGKPMEEALALFAMANRF